MLVITGGETSPNRLLTVSWISSGRHRGVGHHRRYHVDARVAAYIVPFMAGIYIIGCLVIISLSWQDIPLAISTAVSSAFGSDAMAGGALGALIMGFQRALFQ